MKTILIQLDTDPQPSVFDRAVAIDAEVDHLFSYGNVRAESVEPLVHGAMFTRGPEDLHHTAIFIGGTDVAAGEQLLARVCKTFFGPVRVSVMMDSNGSNTTAAAAVLSARKHLPLGQTVATVLAGTGPVGQRVAQLLAMEGAEVRIGSRSRDKAERTAALVRSAVANARVTSHATATLAEVRVTCDGASLVVACGAAGVELLSVETRKALSSLKVAIDLNAVPPAGIAGIEVMDKAAPRDGIIGYGAIGVGGLKMKIHKAALQKLFASNDQVLDTAAIYKIGESLVA